MNDTGEDRACHVDDCDLLTRSISAEYCEKHYMRLRRKGTLSRDFREPTGECFQCGVSCDKVFCTRRCQTRFYRGRDEDERMCKGCRKVIPSFRRSDAIFCSKSCGLKWKYNNDPEARERMIASVYRRKKGMAGSHTASEWHEVLFLYDYKCLACGSTENITRDHVIPIKMGGSDDIGNIQPLCRSCNSRKHTRTIDFRATAVLPWSS